jgi:hypothetical protein
LALPLPSRGVVVLLSVRLRLPQQQRDTDMT